MSKCKLAVGSMILSPDIQKRGDSHSSYRQKVVAESPRTISTTIGQSREAELQMKASSPRQAADQTTLGSLKPLL